MELDDQIIAVPIGDRKDKFRGVVKLNDSALEIFELLKDETSENEIVAVLKQRHGDDSDIPTFVHQVLDYLMAEGIVG